MFVGRFQSQRNRTILGAVVVGVSVFAAAALAGIGFARSAISAEQYQYGKVTICHHTHSKKNPTVTITISKNALPAHLKHGDTLGPCPPAPSEPGQGKDNGSGGNAGTPPQGQNPAPPQGQNPAPPQGQGSGADHGKPNDTPGNGNGNGKPSDTPGNGHGNGHGK